MVVGVEAEFETIEEAYRRTYVRKQQVRSPQPRRRWTQIRADLAAKRSLSRRRSACCGSLTLPLAVRGSREISTKVDVSERLEKNEL